MDFNVWIFFVNNTDPEKCSHTHTYTHACRDTHFYKKFQSGIRLFGYENVLPDEYQSVFQHCLKHRGSFLSLK